MKTATLVSCLVLALLLALPQLGAQTRVQSPPRITVDVPFDFMVKQVMFPAGNYSVGLLGTRTFRLQASHGLESVKFATEPIDTVLHAGTARLIFAQENGHYCLRELWMNSELGANLPGPRVEQLRTVGRSRVAVPAICATCK
jgi:hypothetical protein